MTYPTMPRPTDNTGDNHRAAIAALEKAKEHNQARLAIVKETHDNATRVIRQADRDREELDRQQEALQRGIDALRAADQ